MKQDKIHIGTSGFSYKDWLGNFYPQFCSQKDFLQLYCSHFKTVEIDSTYYRIPAADTVKKWRKTSCCDFLFAAKFPRTVTHEGKISDRLVSAAQFVQVMRNLEEKLGPLLLQFPYSFKPAQIESLERIVDSLPDDLRFSVEMRNKAWLEVERLQTLCRNKGIALCLVEHPWMPKYDTTTADFTYVRFLGDQNKIDEDFSYIRDDRKEDLNWWANLTRRHAEKGQEVFIYFNNHFSGHAPTTAYDLRELLEI